jgi:hypothetical protein
LALVERPEIGRVHVALLRVLLGIAAGHLDDREERREHGDEQGHVLGAARVRIRQVLARLVRLHDRPRRPLWAAF